MTNFEISPGIKIHFTSVFWFNLKVFNKTTDLWCFNKIGTLGLSKENCNFIKISTKGISICVENAISDRRMFGQNIFDQLAAILISRMSEEKTHSDASQIIAYPSLMLCEALELCVVPTRSFPDLVAVGPTKGEDKLTEMYSTGIPWQVYPHTWLSEEG